MATVDEILSALGFADARLAQWLQLPSVDRAATLAIDDVDRVFVPIGRAVEELETVAALLHCVEERERGLRGRNLNDVVFAPRAFEATRDHADTTLRSLHELRTRAYGTVAVARNVDTGEPRIFRVAQANVGFPEIGVINRLAPVARQVVSAGVGDEITTPKGRFEIVAVAHLERFGDILGREANFRRMDLLDARLPEGVIVEDLEQAVAFRRDDLRNSLVSGASLSVIEEVEAPDVQRGDAERLGAHFYTRTTKLQEELMQRASYGLLIVHGVAGSGKTSVALGRTKVLCDRGPDEDEDDPTFFRTETAVGFVLNEQLSTYLTRTCATLSLFDMKIREYRDLREELLRTRNLDASGLERSPGQSSHPTESSMRWVRALDAAMASAFADALEKSVADPPQERETVRRQVAARSGEQTAALGILWGTLRREVGDVSAWLRRPSATAIALRVESLASRVDDPRDRFARALESDPAWTGPRHRDLRQNVRNALRERIVRSLRLADAYRSALLALASTSDASAYGFNSDELRQVVLSAQESVEAGKLSDAALDALLAIAHSISLGYAGRQDRDPISHLAQPNFYSQVFIDEYQDFTEVQIYIMGGQAEPSRRAVTIVGDLRQQVRTVRPIDLGACFRHATDEERIPAMLLENKRQTGPLARLSQRFREDVLGDVSMEAPGLGATGSLPRFVSALPDEVARTIEDEVMRLPRACSVAIICPSRLHAEQLERELRDPLTSQFRETRVSTHGELTRRFFVHFTTALDAKGLEFDAVIVPVHTRLDGMETAALNSLYVAFSRPRQHLAIVASADVEGPVFGRWMKEGLLERSAAST